MDLGSAHPHEQRIALRLRNGKISHDLTQRVVRRASAVQIRFGAVGCIILDQCCEAGDSICRIAV